MSFVTCSLRFCHQNVYNDSVSLHVPNMLLHKLSMAVLKLAEKTLVLFNNPRFVTDIQKYLNPYCLALLCLLSFSLLFKNKSLESQRDNPNAFWQEVCPLPMFAVSVTAEKTVHFSPQAPQTRLGSHFMGHSVEERVNSSEEESCCPR